MNKLHSVVENSTFAAYLLLLFMMFSCWYIIKAHHKNIRRDGEGEIKYPVSFKTRIIIVILQQTSKAQTKPQKVKNKTEVI